MYMGCVGCVDVECARTYWTGTGGAGWELNTTRFWRTLSATSNRTASASRRHSGLARPAQRLRTAAEETSSHRALVFAPARRQKEKKIKDDNPRPVHWSAYYISTTCHHPACLPRRHWGGHQSGIPTYVYICTQLPPYPKPKPKLQNFCTH